MKRILMVVAVAALMVAMVVVMALPAMAAPGNGAKHFDTTLDDGREISVVGTPSGGGNATIKDHPEGSNAGGTGGGGAGRIKGPIDYGTEPTRVFDPEHQTVVTPSGNSNTTFHEGPTK